MASSYTSSLGLEKQADGENANTWGLRLNQSVIDLVDEAVAGYTIVALTSGIQTDLTVANGASDAGRHASLEFTGDIAATVTVTVPTQQKTYTVINSVTNGGSVFIKNAGADASTGQTIVSGEATAITTNGSLIKKVTPDLSSYAQTTDITDGTIVAGKAVSATNANTISVAVTAANANYRVALVSATDAAGNQEIRKDNDFYFNPSTNQLNVGSLVATGDVTAFSDVALKSNIETLDGAKAFAMRGVSFDRDNKQGSGVVAQELEKIAPELVVTHDNGLKSVAYSNIVGYLIEAVKHLKNEIEELKAKK